MSKQPDGVKRVAIAILKYLKANPQAEDSAGGISQWWLQMQKQGDAEVVQLALEELVREGKIRKTRRAGGSDVYSMVRGK